mmetsp:Transcript_13758/g.41601  ORF Transcript_13758/g.41601 Transcript_13758/m.41601 type:complete len:224 (-) Transcript_13758:686-1357(-)
MVVWKWRSKGSEARRLRSLASRRSRLRPAKLSTRSSYVFPPSRASSGRYCSRTRARARARTATTASAHGTSSAGASSSRSSHSASSERKRWRSLRRTESPPRWSRASRRRAQRTAARSRRRWRWACSFHSTSGVETGAMVSKAQSRSTKGTSEAKVYCGRLGLRRASSKASTISGSSKPSPTNRSTAMTHRTMCHRKAMPVISRKATSPFSSETTSAFITVLR